MTAKPEPSIASDWDNLTDQDSIFVDLETQADMLRFDSLRGVVIYGALTFALSVALLIAFARLVAPSIAAVWFNYDLPASDQTNDLGPAFLLMLATFCLYVFARNFGVYWAIVRKKVPPIFAATPGINIGEVKFKVEDDTLSIAWPLAIAQFHLCGMACSFEQPQHQSQLTQRMLMHDW
jgi:hypothetical protein